MLNPSTPFLFGYNDLRIFNSSLPPKMITRLIGIAKSGIYRTYLTASFYELFPKTFHMVAPQDSFIVNDKSLRREYRSLQSESHPDISSDTIKSSNINRAYTTLKNPYTRIAHFIHLKLPNHVNITDDAVAKN